MAVHAVPHHVFWAEPVLIAGAAGSIEIEVGSTSKMLNWPYSSTVAHCASAIRGRIRRVAISSRGNSIRFAWIGSAGSTARIESSDVEALFRTVSHQSSRVVG